jgi:hypothetical protein
MKPANLLKEEQGRLHLRLFTRKLSDKILMWQVFWLALLLSPSRFQWQLITAIKAYSYGDSTGLSPDFPFNL